MNTYLQDYPIMMVRNASLVIHDVERRHVRPDPLRRLVHRWPFR